MLNELYVLSNDLKKSGLLEKTTHPDVNKIGKCECLLVEINNDKLPREIRFLPKNETNNLWKHSKGNHNSFPAIKIQFPFLQQTVSEYFDNKLKELKNESEDIEPSEIWERQDVEFKKNLLSQLDYTKIEFETHKLKLQEYTQQQLAPVLNCPPKDLKALSLLLQRFPKENNGEKEFKKQLIEKIKNQISATNEKKLLDFFKLLLVGKFDKKSKKYVSGCMFYFDIYETDEVYCKVIDPKTERALIKLLNKEHVVDNAQNGDIGICVLSGQEQEIIKDAYPQPNLPVLGNTYLYSKNTSAIPCLIRYKLDGSNAFTASKETVNSINDALAFLTKPRNENKTWKYIDSSNRKDPNLLLAYLEDDPQNKALLAEILDEPTDRDEQEDIFNQLCEQVLGDIGNVLRRNPRSKINLIILEKLDKGRKQILYGNSLSVEQFEKNLRIWNDASQNYPPIKISVWDKKIKKFEDYNSFNSIFPGKICNLLKIYYKLNKDKNTSRISLKNEKQQTSAISIYEVYRLYMPQNEKEEKDNLLFSSVLERTFKKTNFMLSTIAQQNILSNFSVSFDSALQDAFNSISFISILLWKLNIKKEKYMNDIPFNIGQFLKCADLLHKEYCVQVRNKGKKERLPNQLIGNQLFPIATQNPNEALCRLGDRMRIYIAWARTYEDPDPQKTKYVNWILARYGEVSERIHACKKEIPEIFNIAEKAQVLLGYLATIPYEKKSETDKNQQDKK